MTITIKELAAELGMDRSYLRRYALGIGVKLTLQPGAGLGQKPLLTVTDEGAAKIRKRRSPGYIEPPPTPDKRDKALAKVIERAQLSPGRPQVGDFVRIGDRLERLVGWESSFPEGPEGESLEDEIRRAIEWGESQPEGTYEGRFMLADPEREGRIMVWFFGPAPHAVWEQGRQGDTIVGRLVPTEQREVAEFWMPRHGQTNRVPVPLRIKARVWAVTQ